MPWETECLNARFPLPTLLCAGYSVKLNYLEIIVYQDRVQWIVYADSTI